MKNRYKRALAAVGTTAVLGAATAVGVVAINPATAQTVKANETFTGAGSAAAGGAVSQQSCDFTGDGKDDIVTSAWMWDRDGYGSPGASYVIPNGTSSAELDDEDSGIIRIEGPQTTARPSAGALTGFSLSCAGDVNGDKIDDIIIGDYMDKRAYVVFGSKKPQNISLEYLGESGFVIQGDSGRFANSVAGAGDLDGDGKNDLAVVDSTEGTAYLVKGRDDIGTVDIDGTDSDELVGSISSNSARKLSYIAPAGDVNGDGKADLAVGGYTARPKAITDDPDNKTTAHGMAWVLTKPTGAVDLEDDFSGFTINGPARGKDRLGTSITAAGDIDDDGFDDVMIGAYGNADNTGGLAVVRGSDSTKDVDTNPEATTAPETTAARETTASSETATAPPSASTTATPSATTAASASATDKASASATDAASTADTNAENAAFEAAAATPSGSANTSPSTDAGKPSTVYSGYTDRGWWIDADGAGFAVSAIAPQCKGQSGTLVFGSDGSARAWALDTRALTDPLVKVDDVDDDLMTTISGDGDRLGRGIGVIGDYGDTDSAQMVVGADNVGDIGYVSTADVPAQGADDGSDGGCQSPDPSDSADPSDTANPSDSAQPSDSAGPSDSAQPSDSADPSDRPSGSPSPSSSDGTDGDDPATTSPTNPGGDPGDDSDGGSDGDDDNAQPGGPDGKLPITGAQLGGAALISALLIAAGITTLVIARRRKQ